MPKDVVEPPKFITGKHVAAIFEKLGFDATCGQKVRIGDALAAVCLKQRLYTTFTLFLDRSVVLFAMFFLAW